MRSWICQEAEERLFRFAPFLAKRFPETRQAQGIIESPLAEIPKMKKVLQEQFQAEMDGRLFLKRDDLLPIAGSVKARGGIYEVLKHTEDVARLNGILKKDYTVFAEEETRRFFSRYAIHVGSTGNLGLSIGIMSAAVGYRSVVHMSSDAKQWKKNLLRKNGVTVIEYADDYSKAVEEGRKKAAEDQGSYFVDDENSKELFLGYAVSALRLRAQLAKTGVAVGRPSGFVGKVMEKLLSGMVTANDERMLAFLRFLYQSEGIFIEPSSCAAFQGPVMTKHMNKLRNLLGEKSIRQASYIVWATGGSLVPEKERESTEIDRHIF